MDELLHLASGKIVRRPEEGEARTAAPARAFCYHKDYDSLIGACSRQLEQDPRDLRALLMRGNSYAQRKMLEEAHVDFSRALALAPACVEAAYQRGTVNRKLQRIADAIADLTTVLELDPNHVKAAYLRAECNNLAEKYSEAIEDYSKALAGDHKQSRPGRARCSNLPGGSVPGLSSGEGSLHDSPASSTSSLHGFDRQHLEQPERAGELGGSQGHRRQPSAADAAPITSHFSIAAVLKAPKEQQGQQQQPAGGSINVTADSRLDACERSAGEASVSGRGESEGAPWSGAQQAQRLRQLALHDGTGSVPMEEASPPKAPCNRASSLAAAGTGGRHSATCSAAAAAAGERQGGVAAQDARAAADEHHARGYALRKVGDFTGAVGEYTAALAHDPCHFRALFNRAFSHDKLWARPTPPPRPPQLGDHRAALRDYEAAIALDPASSYARYNAGIAADRLGNFAAAVALFSTAIVLKGDNPDFYHNRGFSLRKMMRYEEAVADYSRALELAPAHAKALYNRAVARERLHQHAAALDDYSRVLELEPGNIPALLNRAALLLHRLQQPAAAAADTVTVLVLEGGAASAAAWHLRGEALSELGQGQEALEALDRACALDPSPMHLRSYGVALRAGSKYEAAVAVLTQLLAAAPGDEAGLSARGFCHRKLGALEAAVADYTALLELAGGQAAASSLARIRNSRAFCLASMGRFKAALADYDAALALEPRNMHALMNRGISLDKLGRHHEAVRDFGAVLALEPDNATALLNRAAAHDSISKLGEAVADYQRALDGK
eukprot:scaffold21.g2068.t1